MGEINRTPGILLKMIDDNHMAVRFEQIGDRNRFRQILQRFRSDFLLAECKEIEGLPWWLITTQQQNELTEFCKRNGLRMENVS